MPTYPELSSIFSSTSVVEEMASTPETVLVDQKVIAESQRLSDVMLIQGMIGLLDRSSTTNFVWNAEVVLKIIQSPISYPLLGCLILHANARHSLESGKEFPLRAIRTQLSQARLRFDWFSEPKALLCADHLGLGRQKELYLSQTATGIRDREHFESLIFPYVEAKLAVSVTDEAAFKWRAALTSIVFELFENTDLHGRTDWHGKVLHNSIRGLLFRDTAVLPYQPGARMPGASLKCLEIGVFDSGVGYYGKKTKGLLGSDVSVREEWEILHQCLSTHLEDGASPNLGKGQRGIGLYEVLRALKFLNGAIEFRTGRLHAYRSFLPGDLLLQMESKESKLRPNMPKPTLLDYSRKFFAVPTEQLQVVGSAVRVLVPFG